MKALLLSAYAAHSHVHWQQALLRMFPDWQWQVLSLPPRHFSWRVRGNPLYWSIAERGLLEQDYGLLVATSMVDLATLRGLVPSLARIPAIVYFHENQFDYPQHARQHSLLEAQMVSLYSALAADRIVFNSAYNRDGFLAGCRDLLQRLPDYVPAGVVAGLDAKASTLPVPIELPGEEAVLPWWPGLLADGDSRPLRLLWSGRFEHDKGGDGLLQLLLQLERSGLDYQLAMLGQQFRNAPPVFARIEQAFSHRLVQFGYLESPTQYRAILAAADVIVATATHEFQGLAVLEAVASGCLPAVPARLAYTEIYPDKFCYDSHPQDPALEAKAAAGLVIALARDPAAVAPDVSAYGFAALQSRYRQLFCAVAGLPA
jgi:glycosyltransferase involved in cell wall biosynthesis